MQDYAWVRSPATANLGSFLYACGGCMVTGLCLGFGSSFWHDLLGTVLAMRDRVRELSGKSAPTVTTEPPKPEEG